ncbi:DNA-directed RNA polymerase II subunit GRINL1A [Musca vetustissima]|uniref:DNA-directed RNA polymerase II subunit GRINL1A n=1 Tax=Musca vetustissima TaxID=27455 RepID=UPI002AB6B69D|nr:DNA-directed RNA polymerase II subunit GRINL1A [Musca vetustissima]
MATIPRPTLNRIPGMPIAKKEVHVKDLTKLTQLELLDIKEREAKLLANKAKLQKLPDKGKRIQDFYDKVVAELNRRSNVDEAAKMFSGLNIASKGQKALNDMEWRGRINTNEDGGDPLDDVLDSDDELEMDPLRIIAQKQMHERKVKIEKPEPKLITEEDLKEIESFKSNSPDSEITTKPTSESNENDTEDTEGIDAEIVSIDIRAKLESLKPKLESLNNSLNSSLNNSRPSSSLSQVELDPHVHYLVEKTELHVSPQKKEKFLPFRTTKSNVHDPTKERERKKGKHWEITAATPPPIQHNAAQLLSLMDSVEIQADYLQRLKELQEKQATERLAAKLKRMEKIKMKLPNEDALKSNPSFTNYRSTEKRTTNQIEGDQTFNEEDEVTDPLDEEKSSGVNYTVYD